MKYGLVTIVMRYNNSQGYFIISDDFLKFFELLRVAVIGLKLIVKRISIWNGNQTVRYFLWHDFILL